jgi:lipoyltransferase/lipoate-protein ligase
MKYISLPEHNAQRRLSFYLAMEEHVARHVDEDDLFFMWQVEPTVIFGRNQLIENEVNVDYCRQHGIQMYRRKSGGGCVYADMTNVMFSYVTKDENVNLTFNRYINMVVLVLRRLGVEARSTGRNDVMIGDRKVSGNAFYHIPGRSIVHGTMLYDTCMEHMVGSITPSDRKLVSKGVQSVRQHIALLKDYITLTLPEFMAFVQQSLCDGEIRLMADDVRAIEVIEQEYLSDAFIYGNNPRYTEVKRTRIDGVGELEARLEVRGGVLRDVNLMGDYFLTGELDALLSRLRGVRLEREALLAALPESVGDVVRNLRREDFINLLLQ